MKNIVKKDILGVGVSLATPFEVLEYIFKSIELGHKPYYIVTPNPEMIMLSRTDASFREVLNGAEVSLCDGTGLLLAGKILGVGLKGRITGTDLMDLICKESVRKPVSIGFLGGRGQVAQRAAECLQKKYPGLNVAFIAEEWSEEGFNISQSAKRKGQSEMIDILFVAYGAPKQEYWMAENVGKIPFNVAIGVGGAFDYLSGDIKRAPMLMRSSGLEWLYRLIRQPWRWRRQLALLQFISLVLKQSLQKN